MAWSTNPDYSVKPQCRHSEVSFQIKNVSFANTNLHYLELYGFCTQCQKTTRFVGITSDRRDLAPSMTSDGVMVRLPFVCDGDELKL